MILSNVEIHRALDEKRLVLYPEPSPRFSTANQTSPYQTSAVDLRLGDEISHFKEGLPLDINLNKGSFAALFSSTSVSHKLTAQSPFSLHPGKLVLCRTLEQIELPIVEGGVSLAARVEGKSSYARCGLLVHFTAPTIHTGFKGSITLELINLGPYSISLYPGTPICQLIVEEVLGIPIRNDSQFQGQTTPGGHKN
jgi:dCTP deaminase